MKTITVVMLMGLMWTGTLLAGVPVQVTINGEVEFNLINPNNSRLGNVMVGDAAAMSFLVDSDMFVDSMSFPTRAYEIDQASYDFTLGGESLGLQSPFPVGQTPWFVLRDNDPAVDGFFVSDNPNFPNGVPTDEAGAFGQFKAAASVTYDGSTLSSLDILDALGTYDFTGLTVFNYTVVDGPVDAIGVIFSDMTIEAIPEPNATFSILTALVFTASVVRRRRSLS